MTAPVVVPEKKKRNTHHWKAIAQVALREAAEHKSALEDAALKRECDRHAADLEAEGLRKRVRFWRDVAVPAWTVLVLGVLARVVL